MIPAKHIKTKQHIKCTVVVQSLLIITESYHELDCRIQILYSGDCCYLLHPTVPQNMSFDLEFPHGIHGASSQQSNPQSMKGC